MRSGRGPSFHSIPLNEISMDPDVEREYYDEEGPTPFPAQAARQNSNQQYVYGATNYDQTDSKPMRKKTSQPPPDFQYE